MTEREYFEVYALGPLSMSVCTNIKDRKEIERQACIEGIGSWSISDDSHFASGQTNPCPCEDKDGYKHYLLG